jgi:predicted naringenin-chalcone synthase
MSRYGVKPAQISRRHFECADHIAKPEERRVYVLDRPNGAEIGERMRIFAERAYETLQEYFRNETAPDHLIHVTCTGYVSPSAAQRTVAQWKWQSEVTHAYHMGCYASLPSIRLACGQAALGKEVALFHSEMCSLHVNPGDHSPEQMVVQTLFADGHAGYRISSSRPNLPVLRVHKILERIVPGTETDMTWSLGAHSMAMSLSREIPNRIQAVIRDFTLELIKGGPWLADDVLKNGIFAVHPGGPKIIDTVAQTLEVSERQTGASRAVLFERGNMSSATLPHIWERIFQQPPANGTPIVSLAFGPGLTIFGGLFEYQT